MYLREACVETFEEAVAAQRQGADRIEYCSHLELDGLSPEKNDVIQVLNTVKIPVMVMIRPRGGNFEYSIEEFEKMKGEINVFKKLGVQGVVFGINKGQCVDIERTRILAELAAPLEVCFHKAIDEVSDPVSEIRKLSEIPEITRVLTSGTSLTALEGVSMLKKMIKAAEGRISIMPAGKVVAENIDELHQKLGAKEYHGRRIVG